MSTWLARRPLRWPVDETDYPAVEDVDGAPQMQKTVEQAQTQIEQALIQCRKPLSPDLVNVFPIIDDWCAIADHDVPHIHGTATFGVLAPRPILTAAVIVIETTPGLVIRCLDGCYRLGQPLGIDEKVKTVGAEAARGRIAWPRFLQLVDAFCLKLSDADDGIC
ncbi:hypothetical protein RNZ50_09460 [Paracoccaceae bacterium Fryx2]|nr:hypothetical protein [Paracoccaceae bacterium Fryx2]